MNSIECAASSWQTDGAELFSALPVNPVSCITVTVDVYEATRVALLAQHAVRAARIGTDYGHFAVDATDGAAPGTTIPANPSLTALLSVRHNDL